MTYQEARMLALKYARARHGDRRDARIRIAKELKELDWIWRKDEEEFLRIVNG
jgi:hypothetical protein